MGWQDRSYYRDSGNQISNPILRMLMSSLPLFRVFGIQVRVLVVLLITVVSITLFGWGNGHLPLYMRAASAGILFVIVLLHEFGHCFAARWVGGEADEIVMHPLGGLALARPPHRPWPVFATVAGGPAVNVLICIATGAFLLIKYGFVPWNPISPVIPKNVDRSFWEWGFWVYWVYFSSLMLLAFNLMPIFPLDGGQMLQSILWPKMGYYRSMNFASTTGMVGAGVGGVYALATFNLSLAILAVCGFLYCLSIRRQLQAQQPEWGGELELEPDYAASLRDDEPAKQKQHHLNKSMIRKAQKKEEQERQEQEKVDQILAKVSAQGLASLSWWERRTLRKATEHQRQRDEELKEVERKLG